ncbi:MAG: FAD-dependent oxidoreductase [Bryobacterales bacterium]|nr:FAD-dependent oxidoreductase [Bryobacterales bacterium]
MLPLLVAAYASAALAAGPATKADVIVVGAGIAGLSAAAEGASAGLRVSVVDMGSVFGGHAVMSSGGLSIAGTPLQKERGFEDTPEIAERDFLKLGEDANEEWVRLYARESKTLIYDWLTSMGVRFNGVSTGGTGDTGNTFPRFHMNPQLGYGIISPIYRACLKSPGVTFHWNIEVTELVWEDGRVRGIRGRDTRTGADIRMEAPAVLLATGGYESNLELVRKNWPSYLGQPETVLTGSGLHSMGSGLGLAEHVGAATRHLDHQWIYTRGIPDPRHLEEGRGLYFTAPAAIWVNAQGERFADEMGATKPVIRRLMAQKPPTYWMIFDAEGAKRFSIAGPDWQDEKRKRSLVLENPKLVKSAQTIGELARVAGLPVSVVERTVARWNEMIDKGEDTDFHRNLKPFPVRRSGRPLFPGLSKIAAPPFYAARMYPLARKSMGGLLIDLQCRVLNARREPIPGLYAAGEVTGMGGINGKAALEGTFLGPSLVQGRLAARAIAAAVPRNEANPEAAPTAGAQESGKAVRLPCETCHPMAKLVQERRKGYWHFDKVHSLVMERKWDCLVCHAEMSPFVAGRHKIDRMAQVGNCLHCHLTPE